jgi:hypothetical protein
MLPPLYSQLVVESAKVPNRIFFASDEIYRRMSLRSQAMYDDYLQIHAAANVSELVS